VKRLRAVVLLLVAGFIAVAAPVVAADRPIVVLISIDGWRHDYLDRFKPPTLTRLAAAGVRAKGLIPQFPSKTFPNHYTVVTGLRPANHGIVSNNMVASDLPGRFSMSNRDVTLDPRWWGGEPIWNTLERQGGIAAAMFWPGSETLIGGRQPTFWSGFDDDLPHEERVARVLEWLGLPESKRPSFLTLYFSDVDTAGHRHGPDSPEVRAAALKADGSVGALVAGVERLGLASRVHYVIVSDHGMAALSRERLILLDDYIDPAALDVIDGPPVLAIAPKDGDVGKLYQALKGKHPALDVYKNADIPAAYRLAGHPRVAPLIGIVKEGWTVASRRELDRWSQPGRHFPGGTHGYDPRLVSMHGLFIATGPRLQAGRVVDPFENIHVYELMCALLGIESARNDGDPRVTRSMLR
jgi:predicted AlkP superfamily pyrophosphatase or phosphodiesterase